MGPIAFTGMSTMRMLACHIVATVAIAALTSASSEADFYAVAEDLYSADNTAATRVPESEVAGFIQDETNTESTKRRSNMAHVLAHKRAETKRRNERKQKKAHKKKKNRQNRVHWKAWGRDKWLAGLK